MHQAAKYFDVERLLVGNVVIERPPGEPRAFRNRPSRSASEAEVRGLRYGRTANDAYYFSAALTRFVRPRGLGHIVNMSITPIRDRTAMIVRLSPLASDDPLNGRPNILEPVARTTMPCSAVHASHTPPDKSGRYRIA